MKQSKYDTNKDGVCDGANCSNLVMMNRNVTPWTDAEAVVVSSLEKIGIKVKPRELASSAAYTTIQTVVYRLEEKGALRKVKKVGNAFIFEPAVTRDATHRRLIDDLLDLLDGSTRPLMAHLVDSGRLSLDDLKEIEGRLRNQELEGAERPARGKADAKE